MDLKPFDNITMAHSTITDEDLVELIYHNYPKLSNNLKLLLTRFEQRLDRFKEAYVIDDEDPMYHSNVSLRCPECGTSLAIRQGE